MATAAGAGPGGAPTGGNGGYYKYNGKWYPIGGGGGGGGPSGGGNLVGIRDLQDDVMNDNGTWTPLLNPLYGSGGLLGSLLAWFGGGGGDDTPVAPDPGTDSNGPDQSLGGGPPTTPVPPLESPPSPGATTPETPPGSQAPAPQSGSDSTSTPDSSSSAANDPIVGADDNSGGDWGTPDTWAGGEPLSPEWEGFNAGVGTFFAGLDQTFLGGGVADGMQVWSNTAGQDMGSAQRIYVSAGTGVATFFGVRQLSDAGAEHDAVDAHAQSTGERVSKGALGSVQVVASALGIKAALGAAGIPFGSNVARTRTPIWSQTANKSSAENAFGHWQKHGAEFPEFQNSKQYVEGAQDFMGNPPAGTLTKSRPATGDTLFYHPPTNTFAVQAANGAPRTMFRPGGGMGYWNSQ